MFKKVILTVLLIPFFNVAQVKYGKVDKSEFASVALSGEEDVDAIILYREDHTFFNVSGGKFFQTNTVHERILIKSEEGLEYATKKIYLYNKGKGSRENLSNVNAAAYNLVNDDVEKNKLSRRDIFEEELNEFWRTETFTIPGAKVGSIIEYEYKKSSSLYSIDDKIIQFDIPVNKLDLKVTTHENLIYNVMGNPQSPYLNSKLQTGAENGITFSSSLGPSNNKITIELEGVPSLINEPYSGDKNLYRAKLIFELSGASFPGQVYESFSSTWEDVSKTIYNHSNFGKQIGNSKFFKDELSESIPSNKLDLNNAYEVLSFLKSKIRWNGSYGKYCENGVKKAYNSGTGNVADVNLLLINMLKEKGYNAFPVLISSKNNGIPIYPTLDGFDYVIADLIIDNKHYLIDATEEYASFNVLPERCEHWLGRILYSSEKSDWVSAESKSHSKDILVINAELKDDLKLGYKAKRRLTRKMAMIKRSDLSNQTIEDINKKLEGNNAGLVVAEHEIENLEDYNQPLDLSYSGVYNNGVQKIGDKLYISPLLYNGTDENPFKAEKRQLPIDMIMPMESKTIANIVIPDGYEVETLPQSTKGVYQDGKGSYSFLISQNGNMIITVSDFRLDNPYILPEEYQIFKNFFSSIVNKDAEKIVLRKKS